MRWTSTRDDGVEEATFDIGLQPTDYYSYRVVTALADTIYTANGLREKLANGLAAD